MRGLQRPRVRSVPPRADLHADSPGELAVEFAAEAGLILDEWQRFVLVEALAQQDSGRWAAREVGLCVPRQNGKGSVLEALELAALFLPSPGDPPPLILHSAHEYKTADEHFRRMRDLIEGSDRLRKKIRIVRTASGSQAIELKTGARLRFVTRSSGSGRGFSPDLVVMDEAFNLSDDSMAAVLFALSARPNPQIWYTSSAGMPNSSVLARVRGRGLAGGDPQLAYFEWSAAEGSDLDDRDAWAQANPALSIRVTEGTVASERLSMPDEQFGRERLGLWADEGDRLAAIPAGVWSERSDPDAPRGTQVAFGVDVAQDRSAWVAVAWRRDDGSTQVMLADPGPSSAFSVVARCAELSRSWAGSVYASGSLEPELVKAGVPAVAVKSSEFTTACGTFTDGVRDGRIRHGNQAALNEAVRAARWRAPGTTGERAFQLAGAPEVGPLAAAVRAMHGLSVGADVALSVW